MPFKSSYRSRRQFYELQCIGPNGLHLFLEISWYLGQLHDELDCKNSVIPTTLLLLGHLRLWHNADKSRINFGEAIPGWFPASWTGFPGNYLKFKQKHFKVNIQTNIIFKEGGQMAVFVNNPGDLRKPDSVPELMRILERFEHAAGSVGSSSTQMWLNPYLPFIGLQNRGSIAFKYKYLPEFFSIPEYHRWSHFVSSH